MTLNILALAKQVEELIKNGGSGGTSDYEQLSKKPQINSHTLIGNKSAHDLGLATEEAVGAKSAKADIATEFSTATSYTAGNYVYYEGTLYIFNVDHAAGDWDIADVVVANVTDEVTSNKAAIDALDTAVSGKSTVTANPEGTSSGDLSSIGINGTKYNIPSGGGLPTVSHPGEMLVSKLSSDYQSIEVEWKDIKAAIGGNAVPVGTGADVGKVLGKTGSGTNDIGWVTPGGNSEVTIFDGDVEEDSGTTGYFVREIPLADRIELCEGVHAKYKTLTIEASYIKSRPQDEKTETVNISRTFDLERLLIGDAQTYNDPQYDTDNTAHVILRNDELVDRIAGERYLITTIQINQNGTDPANNTYKGKLFRITFSYYTFNNGNTEYLSLPKEQKVRVKITAK